MAEDADGRDAPGAPARVLIVDDHEVVAASLSQVLDHEPDLTVVGAAGTPEKPRAQLATESFRSVTELPATGVDPCHPVILTAHCDEAERRAAAGDTKHAADLLAPVLIGAHVDEGRFALLQEMLPALEAVADHGEITGDQVTGNYADAKDVLDSLERLGVSYADVVAVLEREGVDKFEKSWGELLTDVQEELTKAATDDSYVEEGK